MASKRKFKVSYALSASFGNAGVMLCYDYFRSMPRQMQQPLLTALANPRSVTRQAWYVLVIKCDRQYSRMRRRCVRAAPPSSAFYTRDFTDNGAAASCTTRDFSQIPAFALASVT